MTEGDRRRAIQLKLARSEAKRVARILTGFPTLDAALEGGLPRGSLTEIAGGPASGKSTLALSIVARAQQDGLSAAWIDAERVFDPAYAARTGVSLERLPVARPDTAEESLEIARRLAASGGIELLVLDSVAALTPALELEIGLGEGGPGLQARVLASGFRRLALAAARTETAVLVLNQIRSSGGESAAESSAGGPPVKLYAAVRIVLDVSESPARVRFRILRSKLSAGARTGELRFESLPESSGTL